MQKDESGGKAEIKAEIKTETKDRPENASEIARQFLALFNGSLLYGSGHPNTVKNAAAFAELVNAYMGEEGGRGAVTVLSRNGTMIIEGLPVTDASLNAGKLLSHFERLAVESVGFERGVPAESVARLMELAGDGNLDGLERFKAELADVARGAAAIPGILINGARYGKAAGAAIYKGMNGLTADAAVELVRGEYGAGKTPADRLARTIIRVLPDDEDLMCLLPQIKEMLIAEGMPLCDYLELVPALGLKMESESLSDPLKEAAESAGASVSELVAAIRSKPAEAGSLTLLAAEARQAVGAAAEGDSGLAEALAMYMEEVSSKIAVDKCAAAGGSAALKGIIAQLEAEIYAQLLKRGVSKTVTLQVRKLLNAGFKGTLAEAGEALAEIERRRRESQAEEAEAEKKDGGEAAADSQDSQEGRQGEDGGTEKKDGEASDTQEDGEIPLGEAEEALSADTMLFLLNKEIKRNLRYKSPFATLIASIEKVTVEGSEPRAPTPEDAEELLPQLFKILQALLRDVDMIGTVNQEPAAPPELFILLPMVGAEGTETVKNRIVKTIPESEFKSGGLKAAAEIKVSATLPGEDIKDLKSYLKAAKANHAL